MTEKFTFEDFNQLAKDKDIAKVYIKVNKYTLVERIETPGKLTDLEGYVMNEQDFIDISDKLLAENTANTITGKNTKSSLIDIDDYRIDLNITYKTISIVKYDDNKKIIGETSEKTVREHNTRS